MEFTFLKPLLYVPERDVDEANIEIESAETYIPPGRLTRVFSVHFIFEVQQLRV